MLYYKKTCFNEKDFFFVLRAISIEIEFVIEIIGSSVIISFSIKFLTWGSCFH